MKQDNVDKKLKLIKKMRDIASTRIKILKTSLRLETKYNKLKEEYIKLGGKI